MFFMLKYNHASFNIIALALLLHVQLGKLFMNMHVLFFFVLIVRNYSASGMYSLTGDFLMSHRLILHTVMLLHELGTVQTPSYYLHAY